MQSRRRSERASAFPRLSPSAVAGAVGLLSLLSLFPMAAAQWFDESSLDTSLSGSNTEFLSPSTGLFAPAPAAAAPAVDAANVAAPPVDGIVDPTPERPGLVEAANLDPAPEASQAPDPTGASDTIADPSSLDRQEQPVAVGTGSLEQNGTGETGLDESDSLDDALQDGEDAPPGSNEESHPASDPPVFPRRDTPGFELAVGGLALLGTALWRRSR